METDSPRRRLATTPAGGLAILAVLGVGGYAAWLFSAAYTAWADATVAPTLLGAYSLFLLGFGLWIALQRDFNPSLRQGWALIALAALGALSSQALHIYLTVYMQAALFPNAADLARLSFYPLVIAGLLLFPIALVIRQQRSLLYLDLALIFVALGMIFWYLLLALPGDSAEQSPYSYLAILYPVGDLVILAAAVALMQRDLTAPARWVLVFIVASAVFAVGADLLFAINHLDGLDFPVPLLNVAWLASAACMTCAAAVQIAAGPHPLAEPPRANPSTYLARLALPYLAVLIGLALLILTVNSSLPVRTELAGILYGAVSLVGLALLRQYLVLRENVRLYRAVQRIAWTDGLTGLYNRHFFNEMLPREIERARRYQESLAVLLLDIDGFKKYNDTYGHLQGDKVLKAAARVFAGQLRASDTIARFGGDEFVVILPAASRQTAQATARRIHEALASQAFGETTLGVSVGVAVYRPGLTPEHLLEEADKDLYRRKGINHAGKGMGDKGSGLGD
ncbi:MAG: GGDEF domain-containing protein [Chloroflexi bacterium]|nr:GGDEF domain-containing protein [Chloroflexota bacterium]